MFMFISRFQTHVLRVKSDECALKIGGKNEFIQLIFDRLV
jgi:hypothetical protein